MNDSRDLFDESTMSFGEHLEVLRTHLIRAIIGLVIGSALCLYFGKNIINYVSQPVERALKYYGEKAQAEERAEMNVFELIQWFWTDEEDEGEGQDEVVEPSENAQSGADAIPIEAVEISPDTPAGKQYQAMVDRVQRLEERLSLVMERLEITEDRQSQAVTLGVEEAFMTYLKVSLIAGLVVSSPWVMYQLWLFVAAGLYPHERKYVYIFLPISTGLFMGGVLFCFFIVFPFVLIFLLGFNDWLGLTATIRMSEWISFAVMLPLMFGISFQLPLIMLFMERIDIFDVQDYREKRRMAILIISVVSMLLTPTDPTSMIAMMVPLIVLYELGIIMCQFKKKDPSPFAGEPA